MDILNQLTMLGEGHLEGLPLLHAEPRHPMDTNLNLSAHFGIFVAAAILAVPIAGAYWLLAGATGWATPDFFALWFGCAVGINALLYLLWWVRSRA